MLGLSLYFESVINRSCWLERRAGYVIECTECKSLYVICVRAKEAEFPRLVGCWGGWNHYQGLGIITCIVQFNNEAVPRSARERRRQQARLRGSKSCTSFVWCLSFEECCIIIWETKTYTSITMFSYILLFFSKIFQPLLLPTAACLMPRIQLVYK